MVGRDIEQWLREVVLNTLLPCVQLRLEHHTAAAEAPIATVQLDADADKEEQIQKILKYFRDSSERHAMAFPKAQTFMVVALAEGQRVIAQTPFRMKPPSFVSDKGGDSEPANHTGIVALELRAAEAMVRMAFEETHRLMNAQSALLQKTMDRIAQLEDQRFKDFDAREKLMGDSQARQIEMLKTEHAENRRDKAWEKATAIAEPIVLDVLRKVNLLPAGPKGKPQSEPTNGKKSKVRAFIASLSADQVKAMSKELNAAQKDIWIELVTFQGSEDEELAIAHRFMKSMEDDEDLQQRLMGILSADQVVLMVGILPEEKATQPAQEKQPNV